MEVGGLVEAGFSVVVGAVPLVNSNDARSTHAKRLLKANFAVAYLSLLSHSSQLPTQFYALRHARRRNWLPQGE